MFCRNCGNQMDNNAAVCVTCGVPVGTGLRYCPNCGNETGPGAAVCVRCGFGLAVAPQVPAGEQKSKMVAGLLAIFLGGLGIHNFYLGENGKGIAHILLSILCGVGAIWGLIDGIMILTGSVKTDANGVPLKD